MSNLLAYGENIVGAPSEQNELNKFIDSSIAPIERTNIASQPYLVGDFLVFDGRLCKVTSAIALGDTLAVGTNIEYDSVANELYAIKNPEYVEVVADGVKTYKQLLDQLALLVNFDKVTTRSTLILITSAGAPVYSLSRKSNEELWYALPTTANDTCAINEMRLNINGTSIYKSFRISTPSIDTSNSTVDRGRILRIYY